MDENRKRLHGEFLADRYRLMAFIRSMIRDSNAAEDIFQEVWLILEDALTRGAQITSAPRWCRGVAKNLILRRWREQKHLNVIADEQLLTIVESAFEEQDTDQDYWRARETALKDCIDKLPSHSKEILSLKYQAGLPIAAIAERLDKSLEGATKMLSRLRAKLRECVTEALQLRGIST